MMIMPRLVSESSARIEGSRSCSNVGISDLMVRSTIPTRPSCMKALTRNRPMQVGLIAKFTSRCSSNSAAWRSFIRARASSTVCEAVSGTFDTGWSLPSILIAGGYSAVRNRSDPFLWRIRRSRSCRNFDACSRSIALVPGGYYFPWMIPSALRSGSGRRLRRLDLASPSQPSPKLPWMIPSALRFGSGRRLRRLDLASPSQPSPKLPWMIPSALRFGSGRRLRRLDLASPSQPSPKLPWMIPSSREVFFHRGGGAGLGHGDHVLADQVGQALVQRLHAELRAGLDRRVHL